MTGAIVEAITETKFKKQTRVEMKLNFRKVIRDPVRNYFLLPQRPFCVIYLTCYRHKADETDLNKNHSNLPSIKIIPS